MKKFLAYLLPIHFGRIDTGVYLGMTNLKVSLELIADHSLSFTLINTITEAVFLQELAIMEDGLIKGAV